MSPKRAIFRSLFLIFSFAILISCKDDPGITSVPKPADDDDVMVNGQGPTSIAGSPIDYTSLKARSAVTTDGIKVAVPGRGMVNLVEKKKQMFRTLLIQTIYRILLDALSFLLL